MNTNEKMQKNNLSFGDKSEQTPFDPNLHITTETTESCNEMIEGLNTNEEESVCEVGWSEENSYITCENLTERFTEEKINLFTSTDLTEKQHKKFCRALGNSILDSIMVLGESGSGKSCLIYYFVQEVVKGNCPDFLKDVQVIDFSSIGFAESSTEITAGILTVLADLIDKKHDRVILFFDNFTRYPTCFWYEYPAILDAVISNSGEFELLKFVVSVGNDEFHVLGEDLKCDVVKSSLMLSLKQEVLPEKIMTTLQPRIFELKSYHNMVDVDYEVLYLIYTLCLSEVDGPFASYKRFLISLDKILSWCEIEKISTLNFETAISYYEVIGEDVENEMFSYKYDLENVARHEAGHTVLALLLSDFIYMFGVSIIKFRTVDDDCADGVTIAKVDDRSWWMNKDNYVKYIAYFLAGKYAEQNEDGGAFDDLTFANYSARHFVCSSGVFNSIGLDVSHEISEYSELTELQKNTVDEEVRSLIREAANYAKRALFENGEFISKMTDALLEKKFLSRDEILKLWTKYGDNQVE